VPELAVPLTSKRRELGALLQKLQHVVPSIPLLLQGIERVAHEGHGWSRALGAAEIVTSVLVVGTFARVVRATRSGHVDHNAAAHHGVDWVDLFLAAMLAVEVWAHWHETGHVKRPTVLLACTMVVLGLLHGRIVGAADRRRGVWVTDDGIHASRRPFSHFRATWADLAAIDLGPRQARLVRRDGELYVLDLGDLRNAADVREVLEAARLRIPTAEQDAEPTPPRAASASS
jgi:hypothetical protein